MMGNGVFLNKVLGQQDKVQKTLTLAGGGGEREKVRASDEAY